MALMALMVLKDLRVMMALMVTVSQRLLLMQAWLPLHLTTILPLVLLI
jgi:hypothetical protein